MNRRCLAWIALAPVLALGLGIAWYLIAHPGSRTQLSTASQAPVAALLSVGVRAPEFRVSSTAGEFNLSRVKAPVLLEVFATWCPHCQRETVTLNRLYKRFGKRVKFISVSGSATGMSGVLPESQADVFAFAQRFAVAYPVAFDPSLAVATRYLQGGFPTLVLISAKQRIAFLGSGEIGYPALAAELSRLLASPR